MKSFFAALTFSACLLPFAAQAGQIVDVNALSSSGTSVNLAAGSYKIDIIGTSQGGAYNGWDAATSNYGLPSAMPAPTSWKDSFTITANGATTSYIAPGDPHSTSALAALATYQSSVLDPNTTPGSVLLNLSSAQSVTFTVSDYLFVDNWGGESFNVSPVSASATPEPTTFGMIGLAVAGVAGLMRRNLFA